MTKSSKCAILPCIEQLFDNQPPLKKGKNGTQTRSMNMKMTTGRKEALATSVAVMLLCAGFAVFYLLMSGCGGTPDLPPCGKNTHEADGLCVADDIAVNVEVNYNPSAFCGEGTHEQNGKCIADPTPPPVEAQFISANVIVSPKDPATIVASYELTAPARVYYKFRFNLNEPWVTNAFENIKKIKGSLSFNPVAPNTAIFYRLEARNDDDKIVDTREGGLYIPPLSTLTVSASSDTPASQTLVMGTTGVELLRFRLEFNAQEEVWLDTVTIKDEMSSLQNGSLKNFKLMNGMVEYAGVSALSIQNSSATFGEFGGEITQWPKGNYAVTLAVRADVTAYADGGMVSFGHRLVVTGATATTKSGAKVKVQIASNNQPAGNPMTIRRAKLSVAWAADSPSGVLPANNGLVIAKFVATNGANVGNYSASVDRIIMAVNPVNMTLGSQNTIRVYADSVYGPLLATYSYISGYQTLDFKDWGLPNGSMSKLEVASGTSRTFLVTMDLAGVSWKLPAGNIWVGITNQGVQWSDGVVSDAAMTGTPSGSKCLIFQ